MENTDSEYARWRTHTLDSEDPVEKERLGLILGLRIATKITMTLRYIYVTFIQ